MPSLYAEIEINASRRRVWQALLRKEQWLYWNTFLYDCDPKRSIEQGRELSLSLRRAPDDEETEFQPRIMLVQPEVCLKWVSSIPGFVNENVFQLQETGRDRTKYIHQENFSGLLTQVFYPFIRQDEQQGIRRMARELKRYVESPTTDSFHSSKRG
ncbi:MAG: SRPBCC domain-containing protein [Stenomitos frigidus ULC029]